MAQDKKWRILADALVMQCDRCPEPGPETMERIWAHAGHINEKQRA